jgi:exodeoxyribonuclease VII small subunit
MTDKKKDSIEEAMRKLESLITDMESGQLPLEKLLDNYEDGVKLVRLCQEKLDAAEQKIQIIKRTATGPAGVEDFSADTNES